MVDFEEWDYEEWDEDFEDFEEEEETCPDGFTWDVCCGCVSRVGVEFCEFNCPFGSSDSPVPRGCYTKDCDKMLDEMIEEMEEVEG